MALSVENLKKSREWSAAIGMTKAKFELLLPYFESAYLKLNTVGIKEAQENLKQDFVLPTYKDFLFFILFVLKNPTTFDVNGLIFGFSQTAAQTNFRIGCKILRVAFELCHQLPKNEFETETELISFLSKQKRLKIDVTEINVQRPKNNESQKEHYSGKKKTYKKIIDYKK
jgi:hypothetical protein